jgi:ABC-2 type transport system ATP-binding protein
VAGILDYTHVTKDYGAPWSRRRVRALDDFSLSLERGEIFGFLGPNGAGKTTAIHLALGFMHPSSGAGQMLGRPFGDAKTRSRVGFLAENVALYHLPARQLLHFFGALSRLRPERLRLRCREVLEQVGLLDEADRNVAKLSRGMQQRIGLAQALISDPELLILDEPTSALDPAARVAMRELLLELNRAGKTIFLSSHLLSEIEMICHRVAILSKGRLLQVGHTEDLLVSRDRYEIVARGVPADSFEAARRARAVDGTAQASATSEERVTTVPQIEVIPMDASAGPDGCVQLTVAAPVQREVLEKVWSLGGEVVSVNPVRCTLEEVFLKLTNHHEGQP